MSKKTSNFKIVVFPNRTLTKSEIANSLEESKTQTEMKTYVHTSSGFVSIKVPIRNGEIDTKSREFTVCRILGDEVEFQRVIEEQVRQLRREQLSISKIQNRLKLEEKKPTRVRKTKDGGIEIGPPARIASLQITVESRSHVLSGLSIGLIHTLDSSMKHILNIVGKKHHEIENGENSNWARGIHAAGNYLRHYDEWMFKFLRIDLTRCSNDIELLEQFRQIPNKEGRVTKDPFKNATILCSFGFSAKNLLSGSCTPIDLANKFELYRPFLVRKRFHEWCLQLISHLR